MKMQLETFRALRAEIRNEFEPWKLRALATHYSVNGLSPERYRWDILLASNFDTGRFYREGLNDIHVDTALRKILNPYYS